MFAGSSRARDLSGSNGPARARAGRAAGLLALLVLSFAFQGTRPLWEPDEGRYANIAVEMMRLGEFVHPPLHHEYPHYAKPPLSYWTIAAGIALGGRSEWAVRAPNALAFFLTVLLVVLAGRRCVPGRPWLAGAIYATTLLPFGGANFVTSDTLLTLWETLAVTAFLLGWFAPASGGPRGWALVMWAGFGLAFLTKGPPGILPLLPILLFVLRERGARGLRRVVTLPGLVVFAVVGLSWYVAVVATTPGLFEYFVKDEIVGRAAGAHHRNAQWYGALKIYLPTFLLGSLPWGLVWMGRLGSLARSGRKGVRSAWDGFGAEGRFLLMWFLVPLVIFALVRSRLALYVLPLFVPLSLLSARLLSPRIGRVRRGHVAGAAALVLLLLGVRWYMSVMSYDRDSRTYARTVQSHLRDRVEEIVFIDVTPRYGLGFYLDTEVEVVCLWDDCPTPSSGGAYQKVPEELAEREGSRVFLVSSRSFKVFEAQVAELGREVRVLGVEPEYRLATVSGRGAP